MAYDVNADSYRTRIRELLDRGDMASLLYAALELRCGVEARMREYIEPLDHIPKAHKKEYSVVKLGRTVDSAFQCNVQIGLFTFRFPDGEQLLLRYIPVPKGLQDVAARVGDALHFPGESNTADPRWWERLRGIVEEGYAWFAFVSTGDLIGLPLLDPTTKQVNLRAFLWDNDPRSPLLQRLSQGTKYQIGVAYEPMPATPPKAPAQ